MALRKLDICPPEFADYFIQTGETALQDSRVYFAIRDSLDIQTQTAAFHRAVSFRRRPLRIRGTARVDARSIWPAGLDVPAYETPDERPNQSLKSLSKLHPGKARRLRRHIR